MRFLACFLAVWLIAALALGQGYTDGSPVTVEVRPSVTVTGVPVTVRGQSVPAGDVDAVKIVIDPPQGDDIELTATLSGADYEVEFKGTQYPGTYTVTATSPDGATTATATFEAIELDATVEEIEAMLTELRSGIDEGLNVVDEKLQTLPPSPPKEEAEAKLAELRSQVVQLDPILIQFQGAFAQARKGLEGASTPEGIAELEEVLITLDATRAEFDQLKLRLKDARSKPTACDMIDAASDAMVVTSQTFNLMGGMVAGAVGLFFDHVVPAMVKAAPGTRTDDQNFACSESIKLANAARDGWSGVFSSLPGFAGDFAQLLLSKVFSAYCERFAGPATLVFKAEFDHNGQTYWTYTVEMKGKLTLRIAKGQGSGPMQVTGQIEGNAVGFDFSEDVYIVEPRPEGMLELVRQPFKPIPGPDTSAEPFGLGTLAHSLSPAYFNLPVEGVMEGDKISLKVVGATFDFSDLVKNQLLLVFATPALPIPLVRIFDFPILKAEQMWRNGFNPMEFVVTVDKEKKTSNIKLERSQSGQNSAGDVRVTWQYTFDVENPPK